MKKFLSIILSVAMVFSMSATAFAQAPINSYTDSYTDELGNTIELSVEETNSQYIVTQYTNGVLDNVITTNKSTLQATEVDYTDNETTVIQHDLNDYFETVENSTSSPSTQPFGEIANSRTYNIEKTYNTDYLYQGNILKAVTKTAAYEPSISNRRNETILNFSQGDKVSLAVSVLLAAFGGQITVGIAIGLVLPVVAGKFTDGFTRSVWMTDYKVDTKVYFNNILTGWIAQTYNQVLVTEFTDQNGVHRTAYADDVYGYNIVNSHASYCASSSAVACSDKYITGNYPNLTLPIRSLPYYPPLS